MRTPRQIALDIGRVLGSRVSKAEQVNLMALLHVSSLADAHAGKPAPAWIVRTITSLSRHHKRDREIMRYVDELSLLLERRKHERQAEARD